MLLSVGVLKLNYCLVINDVLFAWLVLTLPMAEEIALSRTFSSFPARKLASLPFLCQTNYQVSC